MDYATKLKNPKWQRKRLEVFNRDNWQCVWCKDEKTELHVHHLKYTASSPHNEDLNNLITLCSDCHSFYENQKSVFNEFSVTKAIKILTIADETMFLWFYEKDGNRIHFRLRNNTNGFNYDTIFGPKSIKVMKGFFNG